MTERPQLRDKLYYSISEVADHFDVAASVLRYWETEFPELKPKRNSKGTRFYSKENIETIDLIHQLVKGQGYTIQGAKKHLKQNRRVLRKKQQAVEQLKELKSFLLTLRENI